MHANPIAQKGQQQRATAGENSTEYFTNISPSHRIKGLFGPNQS